MTSRPTTATAPLPPLYPSRAEVAELERELDLYLAFWAYAQGGRHAIGTAAR